MKQFKKYKRQYNILFCVLGFLLLLASTLDYQKAVPYMFGDEMVYYMMAQSLAFDGDLEYTQEDLERVYRDGWHAGPLGVFLSKVGQKIYYSKYFIYSWILAPFIAFFGLNGFLILNVSILFLMILMGWLYLRQYNSPGLALFFSMLFFFLTASLIYVFWLTPEVFNMGCVSAGLFLWLYSKDHRSSVSAAPGNSRSARLKAGLQWLLLSPKGRLCLAPIPIAMAAISKMPNVLFFGPIFADTLLTGFLENRSDSQQPAQTFRRIPAQIKTAFIVAAVFIGVIGSFYALQYFYIHRLNPYAGDRMTFYHQYPLNSTSDVWEEGTRLSNDDYMEKAFYFRWKVLFYNLFYYIFGRFTGILPYFFCSLTAVYFFLRALLLRKTPSSPVGEDFFGKLSHETVRRILLAATIGASIMAYIIMAPSNYQGGGGAFGNRFFLNIYPAFLFLVTGISSVRPLLVSGGVGVAFLAQTLINPFSVSFSPAPHAFHGPFRLLPVELTLLDTLPTLVNRHLMQTALDAEKKLSHRLYFFDDNVYMMSPESFWVKGGETAEAAIQTYQGQEHVVIRVTNGFTHNVVDVSQGEFHETLTLAPGETRKLVWPLKEYLPHFTSSVHPLSVRSQNGFVPLFTPESASRDAHFLGCQVSLSFAPLDVGRGYTEMQKPEKAIEVLEELLAREPQNVQARYALGRAYQQTGSFQQALQAFERVKEELPAFRENFLAEVLAQEQDVLPKSWSSSAYVHYEDLQVHLALTRLQYEAESLQHIVGELISDDSAFNAKALRFAPEKHEPGFLAYGPYVKLPAGEYLVKFHINVEADKISLADKAGLVASLDVHQPGEGIIAAKQIRLLSDAQGTFGSYQEYALSVRTEKFSPLEFRVNVHGRVPMRLDRITVSPMFPVRLYEALGESFLGIDEKEKAYHYFNQVTEQVGDVEYIPSTFEALIEMRRWEDVAALVQKHDAFSAMRSGPFTSLLRMELEDAEFSEILSPVLEPVRSYFTPKEREAADFQKHFTFHGLDLGTSEVKAGERFRIAYYWEALQPLDKDYTIFVHFIKQGGISRLLWKAKQLLGRPVSHIFQQDHAPLNGTYPTSRWKVGEIVREQFDVSVPAGIEPGNYDIWLGIYEAESGEKLKSAGKTRVKAGELIVQPALGVQTAAE